VANGSQPPYLAYPLDPQVTTIWMP